MEDVSRIQDIFTCISSFCPYPPFLFISRSRRGYLRKLNFAEKRLKLIICNAFITSLLHSVYIYLRSYNISACSIRYIYIYIEVYYQIGTHHLNGDDEFTSKKKKKTLYDLGKKTLFSRF